MNLILFGFKGVGKTYYGSRLATKLHRPFIDTDDLVVKEYTKQTGECHAVKDLYKKIGAHAFRRLEEQAIQTLKNTTNSIISLGGGAVLNPLNIEFLQAIGTLVYLQASAETLKSRVMQKEIPAFLDEKDPAASFLRMIHERTPIYESIPARRINIETLDEPGVIAALESILLLEDP